jgi:hypothetical protein
LLDIEGISKEKAEAVHKSAVLYVAEKRAKEAEERAKEAELAANPPPAPEPEAAVVAEADAAPEATAAPDEPS